jgi:phosphate-selective porin OprO/OprP
VGGAATFGRTHGTLANPGLTSIKSSGQATIFKLVGGGATDTATTTALADGYRKRFTAHGYYYTGPVGVLAEYVADHEPVLLGHTHTDVLFRAWQVAASIAVTPGDKPTYKSVTPTHVFDPDAGNAGAVEVALRYHELRIDGDAFNEGIAKPAASIRRARSGTVGVNWYATKNIKLQVNYEITTYKGGASDDANRPTEHLVATRVQASI